MFMVWNKMMMMIVWLSLDEGVEKGILFLGQLGYVEHFAGTFDVLDAIDHFSLAEDVGGVVFLDELDHEKGEDLVELVLYIFVEDPV